MCMVDGSDGSVDVIRDERRIAKKPRKCRECWRVIDPGEKYRFTVYKFDDKLSNHSLCAHCEVVLDWLSEECSGWAYGMVEEDAREHCSGYGYGMDLYRAVVGMTWRWRTKSGRLLPVPRRIKTSDGLRGRQGGKP